MSAPPPYLKVWICHWPVISHETIVGKNRNLTLYYAATCRVPQGWPLKGVSTVYLFVATSFSWVKQKLCSQRCFHTKDFYYFCYSAGYCRRWGDNRGMTSKRVDCENSQHSVTSPLVSLQNKVLGTMAKIPYRNHAVREISFNQSDPSCDTSAWNFCACSVPQTRSLPELWYHEMSTVFSD